MTVARAEAVMAISEIGQAAWDACNVGDHPFTSYAFLSALEDAGCVGGKTGWTPLHLVARGADDAVLGVAPAYLKTHSYGEYVFDWAWADAYVRAGGRYYPKLQLAVPFTPVTGPRLMTGEGADAPAVRRALAGAAVGLCEQINASSVHVTFPTPGEADMLGGLGFLQRQDRQFWWANRGYATFDDFLADLSSNRRKTIRRERRDAGQELEIVRLTGSDLKEEHWDAFWSFYTDTGARKWGTPYLNRRFFSLLGERMADRLLLVMARRGSEWIAGALNVIGPDALYGRNWGALEDVPFLHFELCYYQAIEAAIEMGLPRVEAGAQGEHKLARGYLPQPVYSAHFIADERLRDPIARYLAQERPAVAEEMAYLEAEGSPFRNAAG